MKTRTILLSLLAISVIASTAFGYGYSGVHWTGSSCSYYINTGISAAWSTQIRDSDATWDAAGSRFRLNYQGTTTRGVSGWLYDSYNVVCKSNKGNTGALATTYSIYVPLLGWLMDCDMDDPRAYAEEPMKNRMESFIELMEQNKR